MDRWKPDSWKKFCVKHVPEYENANHLEKIQNLLRSYSELVSINEILLLNKSMKEVAEGNAFLLQAGDCAESFSEFNREMILNTIRVILQMSIILVNATQKPVIKMARMAGQFAKPRSQQTEIKNTEEVPSYLGDIINDIIFDSTKRRPAPERMLRAFSQSKKTLEIIRNFELKGSADFHDVSAWNLNFIEKKRQEKNILT